MTDRWLVEISGLRLGPLDRADVEEMIDSGEIRLNDRVCAEGSDNWQRASTVFADEEEVVFLAAPAPSHSQVNSVGGKPVSTEFVSQTVGDPQADSSPVPSSDSEEAAEAYFYIQRDGVEVGPLTLLTVREFVDDGLLQPETPIRGEDDLDWTTAKEYGLEFPVPEVEGANDPTPAAQSAVDGKGPHLSGGLLWLVFAPFFFLTSGGRSVAEMSRRQLVVAATAVLLLGYAGFYVARNWSQTALTGTITLDGDPVQGAAVFFHDRENRRYSWGMTNPQGRYLLMLDSRKSGVMPGLKEIEITTTKNPGGSPADGESGANQFEEGQDDVAPKRTGERIPAKYNTNSTLTYDVTTSSDSVDFELTSD